MSTAEAIAHANTIADIPSDQFPDDAARFRLILWAITGEDVYAYTPFGSDQYVLWLVNRRVTIAEYIEEFNQEKEESNQ